MTAQHSSQRDNWPRFRLIIPLLFGISPIIGVVTLIYRMSGSPNTLELALAVNFLAVIVTSILIAVLADRYRITFFASLGFYGYLIYAWIAVVGWNAGMVFLMSLGYILYLVRLRFIVSTQRELSESLRTQFKGDTIALSTLMGYYILFDIFFNMTGTRFPNITYLIFLLATLSLVLWIHVLWTTEKQQIRISPRYMLVVLGIGFVLVVTAVPALLGLASAVVVLGGSAMVLPASVIVPKIGVVHPWIYQHQLQTLQRTPAQSWYSVAYWFNPSRAKMIAEFALALAVLLVVRFLFYRRKGRQVLNFAPESLGSLQITNRDHTRVKRLSFFKTDNPTRRQVQFWLQGQLRASLPFQSWRTIRDLSNVDAEDGGIKALLDRYETVRYDPDDAE